MPASSSPHSTEGTMMVVLLKLRLSKIMKVRNTRLRAKKMKIARTKGRMGRSKAISLMPLPTLSLMKTMETTRMQGTTGMNNAISLMPLSTLSMSKKMETTQMQGFDGYEQGNIIAAFINHVPVEESGDSANARDNGEEQGNIMDPLSLLSLATPHSIAYISITVARVVCHRGLRSLMYVPREYSNARRGLYEELMKDIIHPIKCGSRLYVYFSSAQESKHGVRVLD
jgi:hypothetical protein